MTWTDDYGDIDPYESDTKPRPTEYEGDLIEDEHGEYNPYAGSQSTTEGRCNATLKYSDERYGETRYCTALPKSCFGGDSEFCKHHVSREAIVKQQHDSFKTGAFAQSYTHLFDKLEPANKIVTIELYESLMGESKYDFDPVLIDYTIDTSNEEFVKEDEVTMQIPIAQNNKTRCQSLLYAALSFMKVQKINEQLFTDSIEKNLGVGERRVTVAVDEYGEPIQDLDEHHLNLPLSRIEKDYKDHLKLGGVDMSAGEDNDTVTVDNREWTLNVMPDEDEEDVEGNSLPSSRGETSSESHEVDSNALEGEPIPLVGDDESSRASERRSFPASESSDDSERSTTRSESVKQTHEEDKYE